MARFNLGVTIAELFGGRFRIAILYPREQINKFTEDAAVNRGAKLLVTSEEGAAVQWLLGETKQPIDGGLPRPLRPHPRPVRL